MVKLITNFPICVDPVVIKSKITFPINPYGNTNEYPTIYKSSLSNSVKKGEDFRLICKGSKSVEWINYPQEHNTGVTVTCFESSVICYLLVLNASFSNSGVYECKYHFSTFSSKINVTVTDSPQIVTLTSDRNVCVLDSFCNVSCLVEGNPIPNITWNSFLCQDKEQKERKIELFSTSLLTNYTLLSQITTSPDVCTVYVCIASNSIGKDRKEYELYGSDEVDILMISPIMQRVYKGQSLKIKCTANKEYYDKHQQIYWKKDNIQLLKNDDTYSFKAWETRFSFISEIFIKTIQKEDEGNYFCFAKYRYHNFTAEVSASVSVNDSESIRCCLETNMNGSVVSVSKGSQVKLFCKATGSLHPNISWYWNNNPVDLRAMPWIKLDESQSELNLDGSIDASNGLYECRANNIASSVAANITFEVVDKLDAVTFNVLLWSLSALLLCLVVIFIIKKKCRFKKYSQPPEQHEL